MLGFMVTIVCAVTLPIVFYLLCVKKMVKKDLKFTCKATNLNTQIVENLKTLVGNYCSPWWYHPIFVLFQFGENPNFDFEREIYAHDDGTQFEVDWFPKKPLANDDDIKLCLHFPGLGTGSDSVRFRILSWLIISSNHWLFVELESIKRSRTSDA